MNERSLENTIKNHPLHHFIGCTSKFVYIMKREKIEKISEQRWELTMNCLKESKKDNRGCKGKYKIIFHLGKKKKKNY